jgi:thiamine biosynthesis lipoprotein
MNTRFELVLYGQREPVLRAAGEEALREIARVEDLISAFRPTSEISAVNARASHEPVQVSPEVFTLLQRVQELHQLTRGTFDITIGPLMKCWGLWGTSEGRVPSQEALREAQRRVGLQHVGLDPEGRTVRFLRQGMTLDLGGIGKGYALDCAVELLLEQGVSSALLQGGTSSVVAIGHPPGEAAWRTALVEPQAEANHGPNECPHILELINEALSVSSVTTKAFAADGRTMGHVLDPRSGHPVQAALMSAVIVHEATAADALSTALLVLGKEGLAHLAGAISGFRGLLLTRTATRPEVNAIGFTSVSSACDQSS